MSIKVKLLSVIFFFSMLHASEYKVVVKGHSAGIAKLEMSSEGNNYKVSLDLSPNMMVRMFGIKRMIDVSKGSIVDGHYFPKSYRRQNSDSKLVFSVDFLGNTVKKKNKGKSSVTKVEPNGQDPLTQIAQIRYDLGKGKLASKYILITEKTQRSFSAKLETLKDKKIVILTQTPKSDRVIKLWFDNELGLYRMQKQKRKKIDFDMTKKDK